MQPIYERGPRTAWKLRNTFHLKTVSPASEVCSRSCGAQSGPQPGYGPSRLLEPFQEALRTSRTNQSPQYNQKLELSFQRPLDCLGISWAQYPHPQVDFTWKLSTPSPSCPRGKKGSIQKILAHARAILELMLPSAAVTSDLRPCSFKDVKSDDGSSFIPRFTRQDKEFEKPQRRLKLGVLRVAEIQHYRENALLITLALIHPVALTEERRAKS